MTGKRLFLGFCAAASVLVLGLWVSTAWVSYTLNATNSLPGTLYVIQKGAAVHRGDLVAYRWHGGATYPAGTIFIKRVMGKAGDVVRSDESKYWVNGTYIGMAKSHSKAGVALVAAQPGVIPAGELFVATPHPDSLDSRYALSGNVKQTDILGRAYEVF